MTGEMRKSFENKKIKYLLPPLIHKLLETYQFRVKLDDFITNNYAINAGVTQFSALSLMLYLIYSLGLAY